MAFTPIHVLTVQIVQRGLIVAWLFVCVCYVCVCYASYHRRELFDGMHGWFSVLITLWKAIAFVFRYICILQQMFCAANLVCYYALAIWEVGKRSFIACLLVIFLAVMQIWSDTGSDSCVAVRIMSKPFMTILACSGCCFHVQVFGLMISHCKCRLLPLTTAIRFLRLVQDCNNLLWCSEV